MNIQSIESSRQQEIRQFKIISFLFGVLAVLPFGFIFLMSLLNTFEYYLYFWVFVGLCPTGAIGLVSIAYAEIKTIWKYFRGREEDKKLTRICLLISFLGFFAALLFIIITYAYTVWTYLRS